MDVLQWMKSAESVDLGVFLDNPGNQQNIIANQG